MSDYTRCTLHGLLRCAMCSRPAAHVPPAAQPPAEILDGPGASAAPVAIDKQAQEAIERNREIAENVNGPIILGPLELTQPWAATPIPRTQAQTIPVIVDPNPVVAAAKEYSDAQTKVLTSIREVDNLRLRLQQAENAYKDAEADREIKKSVLQKLVAN